MFPPQLIDVSAGPTQFQEMHVDGSVVTPVFTLPQSLLLRDGKLRTNGKGDIFVVINGPPRARFRGDAEQHPRDRRPVVHHREPGPLPRGAGRDLRPRTRQQYRLQPDLVDESGPKAPAAQGFNTAYMRALYQDGFEKARTSHLWEHTVPAAPITKAQIAQTVNP